MLNIITMKNDLMFDLKKYRGVWRNAKFEEKLTCGLENDMRNMANFDQTNLIQSRKSMSIKSTEELCVMTMKNVAKFEEELTCHFKIDMRDLMNFEPSTWKSQKFSF